MSKHLLFTLFTCFLLQAADLPKIEIIQATQKYSHSSLKTLACRAIAQQVKQFTDNPNNPNTRAIVQKYARTAPLIPADLHNSLKGKLAHYAMDWLTTIHTTKPIYPATNNWCLSPDGTLVLYQDKETTCRFILKNLDKQEEEIIENEEFLTRLGSGEIVHANPCVHPFITPNNTVIFYSCDSTNPRVFKYSKTKTLEKTLVSCPIVKLRWASDDMKKLFFHTGADNYNVLYDTQTSLATRIQGHLSHIDDDYITTRQHDNGFHCYTTHDGNLYMQGEEGTGESTIHFPYLICTKKTNPDEALPTSLEIWDIPHKQPIRRIVLPIEIGSFLPCNQDRIEITFNSTFCSINLKDRSYKKRDVSLEKKEGEYLTGVLLMRVWDNRFPSRYYVVHALTRKLSIPLVELNGIDVTSYLYANKEMTQIGGLLEGYVPFVYTTPLHTLYKTPLPELLNMLLKRDNNTGTQGS